MDIYLVNLFEYKILDKSVLDSFGYKNFTNEKKRYVHNLTYYLLDKILEMYDINDRKIVIDNNKPILINSEKFFSISHSHNYIAISISDFNCGLDIEFIKDREYEKISKRMNFVSNSLTNFYKNWTLYEANYKLSSICKSKITKQINNFMLSAVSENIDEDFNIIQDYILS